MYAIQCKSTYTGLEFQRTFDCPAFKNQTETFKKLICLSLCVLELLESHTFKIIYFIIQRNL